VASSLHGSGGAKHKTESQREAQRLRNQRHRANSSHKAKRNGFSIFLFEQMRQAGVAGQPDGALTAKCGAMWDAMDDVQKSFYKEKAK